MNFSQFFQAVLNQDECALRAFFHDDAQILWHCTNERFTVDEYVQANCQYPGDWDGEIERVDEIGDLSIAVTHVYPKDRSASFHAVSFIRISCDKIESLEEYWADDAPAPQWRQNMRIGRPIRS